MTKVVDRLLADTAPSRVADAAERLAGEDLAAIAGSLPAALAGDPERVRVYVEAYGRLSDRLLDAVSETRPELTAFPLLRTILKGEAMNAPFSNWVGSLDSGRGTALAVVELLRASLPGGKPLSRPARWRMPAWEIDDAGVVRFYRAVAEALDDTESPLDRIRTVMGLSRTEAAALFGVRRQALDGWGRGGVPAERQAKLASIGAIADLLNARLKADRVPAVVRRPALAYGERSILEAIAADDEDRVLAALREGFDWALAA